MSKEKRKAKKEHRDVSDIMRIAELEEIVNTKDVQLKYRLEELDRKQGEITRYRSEVADKDAFIAELQERCDEADKFFDDNM